MLTGDESFYVWEARGADRRCMCRQEMDLPTEVMRTCNVQKICLLFKPLHFNIFSLLILETNMFFQNLPTKFVLGGGAPPCPPLELRPCACLPELGEAGA